MLLVEYKTFIPITHDMEWEIKHNITPLPFHKPNPTTSQPHPIYL